MDPPNILELIDQLQDITEDLAKSVGMGEYWHHLKREIYEDRQDHLAKMATCGQMPGRLNQNLPNPDQILLVQTLNGRERKIIHLWAEQHQYQHKAIQTPLLNSVEVFRCKDCQKSYVKSDLFQRTDWSTINPGQSYGLITYCSVCGSCYYGEDDEDSELISKGTMVNAVAISQSPIDLPNHVTRSSKHERWKKHNLDDPLEGSSGKNKDWSEQALREMELREVRLMDRSEFQTIHQNIPRPVRSIPPAKQDRINKRLQEEKDRRNKSDLK